MDPMSFLNTSSLIPFNSGKAFVRRGMIDINNSPLNGTDSMRRTANDRKFLEQFERIFLAAAKGDKEECESVIAEGYYDFNAVSFGKFATKAGRLDDISPLQIAQINKHDLIVELFQKTIRDREVAKVLSIISGVKEVIKEIGENVNESHAQIIERELSEFQVMPQQESRDINYVCADTKNRRSLIFDLSASAGEIEVKAFLYDNEIVIRNSTTQNEISISHAHNDHITGICIQGERFYTSSEDKTLKAWNISTGECLYTFTGHSEDVTSLCVQGKLLFSGSEDETIKIWDTETGACLRTLRGHTSTVCSIAVQGQFLVSSSRDKSARIWDIKSGNCIEVLKEHNNCVNVVMIKDGLIFTGSDDKNIIIWNLFTGLLMKKLTGHMVGVLKLEMKEGKLISTTRDSDEIKEWVLKN